MVAATLADATTLVRVAELDATAVGCYELRSSDGADAATFGMFAVEPTHQAAGLGGLLLADAEQVARRRQGERRLRMTVIAQRAELIDWYGRRGYLPTGAREPFPYGDERFGRPRRDDLEFVVLAKDL
jgi:GNAT superfamily N-acetyltransferase